MSDDMTGTAVFFLWFSERGDTVASLGAGSAFLFSALVNATMSIGVRAIVLFAGVAVAIAASLVMAVAQPGLAAAGWMLMFGVWLIGWFAGFVAGGFIGTRWRIPERLVAKPPSRA
jgi:hypothetical protein